MSGNEKNYQIAMYLVRKMLEEELITAEDYERIEEFFSQKYSAVFGTLFFAPLAAIKKVN